MKIYKNLYHQIISPENLFLSWDKFSCGKMKKIDVMNFHVNLAKNIFKLHEELSRMTYNHGKYVSFYIHDPKQRNINKADVRDRVLHHGIFSILNPIFESTFISNSFSCREGKGTHKGVETLAGILRRESGNGTKQCYGLKCDIRKFFDSVDHSILKNIIAKKIKDKDTIWLIDKIIDSYISNRSNLFERKGVPIGNLTSQLFANVYLNELDQFMKHKLKVKDYLRYTDDFMVVSRDRKYLEGLIPEIESFLKENLKLELHPNKVIINKFRQGHDFLGYVVRPHHILMRTKTKKRMFKKIKLNSENYKKGLISKTKVEQSFQSYLGVLTHADAFGLSEKLKNDFWLWS